MRKTMCRYWYTSEFPFIHLLIASSVPQSDAEGASDQVKSRKDSLPPLWVDKVEMVEADISKIQQKSNSINIYKVIF
jgi:hypothetical protein